MKIVSILFLLSLSGIYAMAQKTIVDGNSLQSECVYLKQMNAGQKLNDLELSKAAFCLGYIRATLDMIVVDNMWNIKRVGKDGEWKQPCIPKGVANEQSTKVVLKYFDDNPAELNLPGYILIMKAITVAFPCH
jgi:hypothetical protein